MTDDMGELNKDKTVGKSWCTPELIVIVRSKREEAVLYACKVADGPPAAAGAEEGGMSRVCGVLCMHDGRSELTRAADPPHHSLFRLSRFLLASKPPISNRQSRTNGRQNLKY